MLILVKHLASLEFGDDSQVRATWIGHSTVLAEVGDTVVITDPMFR